jgi:hypothetical protein
MKVYWKFFVEMTFYIALVVLGSSLAVWILQNIFEVFYYG